MTDFDEYNGDVEHDMWVDYTYHEYTGELADEFDDDFDEEDLVEYTSPRASQPSPRHNPITSKPAEVGLASMLLIYRNKMRNSQSQIDILQKEVDKYDHLLNTQEPTPLMIERWLMEKEVAQRKIDKMQKELDAVRTKLPSLEAEEIHNSNLSFLIVAIFVSICIILLLWTIFS